MLPARVPSPPAGAEAGFREAQLRAAVAGRACQRATIVGEEAALACSSTNACLRPPPSPSPAPRGRDLVHQRSLAADAAAVDEDLEEFVGGHRTGEEETLRRI